jgi:hypothetical protein
VGRVLLRPRRQAGWGCTRTPRLLSVPSASIRLSRRTPRFRSAGGSLSLIFSLPLALAFRSSLPSFIIPPHLAAFLYNIPVACVGIARCAARVFVLFLNIFPATRRQDDVLCDLGLCAHPRPPKPEFLSPPSHHLTLRCQIRIARLLSLAIYFLHHV